MRAFSAIKPSGDLHLGNYFGAIKQWVEHQNELEAIYCIVDLHAITVHQKPEELKKRTREVAATYLAAGIDPKKNIIFVQSALKEHAELAWILNTIIRMSELERMTQYKDKARNKGENVSVALFDYPVLMAADILLYDTDVVPIGHDQLQHVELTCDLAKRFNKTFGHTFKIPKSVMQKVGARIMSLDDPGVKMSKSQKNTIAIMDSAATIRKKISRAVTDSKGTIVYDKKRPGISNLMEIYYHTTGIPMDKIEAKFSGQGYKEFKADLADELVKLLEPMQQRIKQYMEGDELDKILADGAKRATELAGAKLKFVKEKMGLL